jgi:peptide/nickel transport system permease protein
MLLDSLPYPILLNPPPPSLFESNEQYIQFFGLDLPLIIQYINFMSDLFLGNWENSILPIQDRLVSMSIAKGLPLTFDITFISLIIATIFSILIGVRSWKRSHNLKDKILRGNSIVGFSIPVFFLGLIFIYFFPIFPSPLESEGYSAPSPLGFMIIDSILTRKFEPTLEYLMKIFLPILLLSFISLQSISWKNGELMTQIMKKDYIRTARAKGVDENVIIRRDAMRNFSLSSINIIKFNLLLILSASIFVEDIFSLNGLGVLFLDSLKTSDYFLLIAVVFVYVLIIAIFNFLSDLIIGILNPAIRFQKEEKFSYFIKVKKRAIC